MTPTEILECALYNLENYRKTNLIPFLDLVKDQIKEAAKDLEAKEADDASKD